MPCSMGEIFHKEKRLLKIQREGAERRLHTCWRASTTFITELQMDLSLVFSLIHSWRCRTFKVVFSCDVDGGTVLNLYPYLFVQRHHIHTDINNSSWQQE